MWSYGHRNVQGLAFDSQGRLWEQEFGNNVMDETNLIVKGGNYGWPACEGTTGTCSAPAGFIAPKHTYPVASGLLQRHHDHPRRPVRRLRARYPAVPRGDQRQQPGQRDEQLPEHVRPGSLPGRIRTVEPAPDGDMWLATSRDGDKDSTPHNSHNTIYKVYLDGGPID